MRKTRPPGRPRTGLDGQCSTTYPLVHVRLPPEARDVLDEIAASRSIPRWRVVADALRIYGAVHDVS